MLQHIFNEASLISKMQKMETDKIHEREDKKTKKNMTKRDEDKYENKTRET